MHPLYNNKIVHTKQITALIISFLFASDETGSVSFTRYWWTDSWNTISISQHTTSSLCLCYSTKNTTLWNGTVKYKHKHNSLPWIFQSNLATRPSSLLLTSKSESSNNLKQMFGCNCLQGSVWACTRKWLVLWLNGCMLSATGLARWIKVCRWPEALTCSSAQWVCAHEQGVPILKGGHRVISFPLQDWLVVFFCFCFFVKMLKCSNPSSSPAWTVYCSSNAVVSPQQHTYKMLPEWSQINHFKPNTVAPQAVWCILSTCKVSRGRKETNSSCEI